MPHCPHYRRTLDLSLLLALSLATGNAFPAVLVAEPQEVATGQYVTVQIEQVRTSAGVKWRSGPKLKLDSQTPDSARFLALHPGHALVTASVDGELASVQVSVNEAAPASSLTPALVSPRMRPVQSADDSLAEPPYLRGVLPADAFAYARLPTLWGVLGTPKGNLFSDALGSAPYADAVAAIRSGMLDTLGPELPAHVQGLWRLLLGHMRAPLEVAVMPPGRPNAGFPDLVATTALNAEDPEAVNAILAGISQDKPMLELPSPLDGDGSGTLSLAQFPVQMYFDSARRRLYLRFADPASQPAPLIHWVGPLQKGNHGMHEAEQAIDQSGQGVFAWISPPALMQTLERMGQGQQVAISRAFGASEARALALGIGVSKGKQRVKVLLDMPQVGFRSFFPIVSTDLPFKSAGKPDMIFMLGLPGADDLASVEGALKGMLPPEDLEQYEQGKAKIKEVLGIGIEELLGAFGDELLAVFDRSGHYAALRVRDEAEYRRILATLTERFDLDYRTREIAGHTYHHLVLPPIALETDEMGMAEAPPLVKRLLELPSHLFWTEEAGYLLFASVPQTLIDYRYTTDKTPVADWLRQTQGVDPSGSVLLASARTDGVPRLMYEFDLWMLMRLGDLVGRPVDLFSLPTPRELGLPDTGAFSFQLTSSPEQLLIELVYESNPVELLLTMGGAQTLVTGGILAAIAIPAYQDYVERAEAVRQAMENAQAPAPGKPQQPPAQTETAPTDPQSDPESGMLKLVQLQDQLLAFYREQQRFPKKSELQPFLDLVNDPSIRQLQIEPNSGRFLVTFMVPDLEGEPRLLVTPQISEGYLTWECESDLPVERIPSSVCAP